MPATAFAEPDKSTPKGNMMWRWFKRADRLPFCFAGIWRPWTGDRGTKKEPTNKLFVRRNARGTSFTRVVDAGQSIAADKRRKAKRKVPSGQGDRGDRL